MKQSEPIALPIQVLSSLYKNVLVADGSSEESAAVQKDTVVCIAYPAPALSAAHHALLKAILKACRLEDHQVELIIVSTPIQMNHETITATFGAKNRILFGLEPGDLQLPVHFPSFQVQSFNKMNYLVAPKLENIDQDKSLKVQLWKALQQLYPA